MQNQNTLFNTNDNFQLSPVELSQGVNINKQFGNLENNIPQSVGSIPQIQYIQQPSIQVPLQSIEAQNQFSYPSQILQHEQQVILSQNEDSQFLIQQQLGQFLQSQGLIIPQYSQGQQSYQVYYNPNRPSQASRSQSRERRNQKDHNFKYNHHHDRNKKFDQKKSRSRSRSSKPRHLQKKNGDWICEHCKNLNFQYRDKCNRCQQQKITNSQYKKSNTNYPKDWKCKKCENINFARRQECNVCHEKRDEVEEKKPQ